MTVIEQVAPAIPSLKSLQPSLAGPAGQLFFQAQTPLSPETVSPQNAVFPEGTSSDASNGGSQEQVPAESYEGQLRRQFSIEALLDAAEALQAQFDTADEPGLYIPGSVAQRTLAFLKHRAKTLQDGGSL